MKSRKRQRNHDFVTIQSENPKVLPLPGAGELFSQSCHIEAGREAGSLILASYKQSRGNIKYEKWLTKAIDTFFLIVHVLRIIRIGEGP